MRYTNDREEAAEVMNQGFFKVLTKIDQYNTEKPFKAWVGKIMMNTSIDYYRSNLRTAYNEDIEKAEHIISDDFSDKNLSYNDLLAMIQQLPPAYRTIFNLFAIEGYSHEEISKMLNISIGTSKSNLHKARRKLMKTIELISSGNVYN
jgi:RNA polymerase sigma-70 factor (ECF subfamily)